MTQTISEEAAAGMKPAGPPKKWQFSNFANVNAALTERGEGFAGQRLYVKHLIPVELPEPAPGAHADPQRHGSDDTRSCSGMRAVEDRSTLEVIRR